MLRSRTDSRKDERQAGNLLRWVMRRVKAAAASYAAGTAAEPGCFVAAVRNGAHRAGSTLGRGLAASDRTHWARRNGNLRVECRSGPAIYQDRPPFRRAGPQTPGRKAQRSPRNDYHCHVEKKLSGQTSFWHWCSCQLCRGGLHRAGRHAITAGRGGRARQTSDAREIPFDGAQPMST